VRARASQFTGIDRAQDHICDPKIKRAHHGGAIIGFHNAQNRRLTGLRVRSDAGCKPQAVKAGMGKINHDQIRRARMAQRFQRL
jgi:hypothetical protein